MSAPLTVALPPGLELSGSYTISVTALDPATGNVVAGVAVSNVTLEVALTAGSADDLDPGPWIGVTGPRG